MILAPDRSIVTPTRCPRCGKWRVRRTLRTPRRLAPRWGRHSEILNSGNKWQVDANHKIQISSNSKIIVAGDTDPCCCVTCGNCDSGTTPGSLIATFIGVTICTGTYACRNSGPANATILTGGSLNGTFPLLPSPDSATGCSWYYCEAPGTTVTAEDHQSGHATGPTGFEILISRSLPGPTWEVSAFLLPTGESCATATHPTLLNLFDGTTPGVGDCSTPFNVSNGFSACNTGVLFGCIAGKLGSVSVTPV